VFGDALVAGGFDRLDALTIAGCTGRPAFFGAVLPVAFTGFITVTFAREIKVSATAAPGFRLGNKCVPLSDGRSDFVTFAPDGRSDSLASSKRLFGIGVVSAPMSKKSFVSVVKDGPSYGTICKSAADEGLIVLICVGATLGPEGGVGRPGLPSNGFCDVEHVAVDATLLARRTDGALPKSPRNAMSKISGIE